MDYADNILCRIDFGALWSATRVFADVVLEDRADRRQEHEPRGCPN